MRWQGRDVTPEHSRAHVVGFQHTPCDQPSRAKDKGEFAPADERGKKSQGIHALARKGLGFSRKIFFFRCPIFLLVMRDLGVDVQNPLSDSRGPQTQGRHAVFRF